MEGNKTNPDVSLNEVIVALSSLADIESKVTKRPIDEEFVQKLKCWSTGLFRIMVMGEIKKGKSSFINALLGVRDLVPVSSNVATSTIYKICYGEEVAYKVFFTEESKKPSVRIGKDELVQYGTEDGNPSNEKQVDFILVSVPSAFLKGGLVIIDTPGLGGLFKQHKRITYEYVPKADAVFMVSDSVESPIGKDELDLLEDIRKVTDQIFFVQTKAMAVDSEARQSRERNNRRTLENHGFKSDALRYYVVDSHLKLDADEAKDKEDLIDSGFIPLAAMVNDEVKVNARQNIIRTAIKIAAPKCMEIEKALADEEKLLSADSEESRKKISDELTTAEEDAANWQRHDLPRLQDRLQDGMREIKVNVNDHMRKFRPGGEMHELVNQTISSCQNLEDLLVRLDEFSNNVANCFTAERYEVLQKVQVAVERLLCGLGGEKTEIGDRLVPMDSSDEMIEVNTAPIERVKAGNNPQNGSSFDKARTLMYGGMAGVGMAGIIGGLIGSIVPGIGTIIGSTAGIVIAGALGANEAAKLRSANELERAKQQAMGAVAQTMASAYQNLGESVQRVLMEVESTVMRKLRDASTKRQEDILRRRRELQQRQTETIAQLNEKRKQLEVNKREFNSIRMVIGRVS